MTAQIADAARRLRIMEGRENGRWAAQERAWNRALEAMMIEIGNLTDSM